MCGISGLFLNNSSNYAKNIRVSLELIKHRGPDGKGIIWGLDNDKIYKNEQYDGNFKWALGHVRLAIIDVTESGHQPMSVDESYWISYNGEVYNYLELKKELETSGYRFNTASDTEVIIISYIHWGEKCVEHFIGMFAFVIVDLNLNKVFCSRDRFGIKPLYFWQSSIGIFIFSELKQLKAFPEFSYKANKQLITDFLIDGVINHIPDQCSVKDIIPLKPGHSISWNLYSVPELSKVYSYWKFPEQIQSISFDDAIDKTREILTNAVKLRLRADVPVGSCLSGGIDSSSIVGIVTRELKQKDFHTFSACFNNFKHDEQYYMNIVSKYCNTIEHKVFPTCDKFISEFKDLIYYQDEPFPSAGVYSQWCVMRAARDNKVKVLLDGQGGDEVFCGYMKYNFFFLIDQLHKRLYFNALKHFLLMLLRGDTQILNFKLGKRYLPARLRNDKNSVKNYLTEEGSRYSRYVWNENNSNIKILKGFQKNDISYWSLPVLLRYEDRNSMAHSIESRVPFIDHRLIEYCFSLPDEYFFINGKSKRLLTYAMSDMLPKEIHLRRNKYGFSTPINDWIKNGLGQFLYTKITSSEFLKELIDIKTISSIFKRDMQYNFSLYSEELFRIGSIAIWADIFKVN